MRLTKPSKLSLSLILPELSNFLLSQSFGYDIGMKYTVRILIIYHISSGAIIHALASALKSTAAIWSLNHYIYAVRYLSRLSRFNICRAVLFLLIDHSDFLVIASAALHIIE